MLRGHGDVDRYISDLSRPDALKASLNCIARTSPRACPIRGPVCRPWRFPRSAFGLIEWLGGDKLGAWASFENEVSHLPVGP
jgi:hypothetical protein